MRSAESGPGEAEGGGAGSGGWLWDKREQDVKDEARSAGMPRVPRIK